ATEVTVGSDSSSDVFSSSSQGSVPEGETSQEWQPTPLVQHNLHSLNSFIRMCSHGNISPIRSQLSSDVDKISSSTNRYYKRKAVQAVETVLDAIAPGKSAWLFQQVTQNFSRITDTDMPENVLVDRLVKLYEESKSWYTRQQILSIFVKDYSKSELLSLIPGLTIWRIDEARKHANRNIPGQLIEPPTLQRCRLEPSKVDHFLDFISSPSFLQDVADGTKSIKLSDGQKLEIPNVVRTVIASRLIHLYQSYSAESGFSPLGRSTLFNILKVCTASQKKSLAGLDSTQTDGVCALGTLEDTSNELSKLGLPEETSKDITRRLRAARHYLKTDYKIHVSRADRCADHCSIYAMSIADAEFHGKCAHDHLITCDRCEDLKNAIVELQLSLSSSNINYSSSDVQEELQYDVDMAALKIEEWKAHVLRANHQDVAKSDIIDSLNTRTYIHVFNQCVQNWFAVASIVEDTMHTLRSTMPNLKSAFLRSDNAGCYHTAFLLLSLPGLGKRSGINILRYDFSDPQAGKDICDRRIATVKSHMRRYINEGNDILSAEDMKMAIESYGGVEGCYAAVILMDQTKQTMQEVFCT
ncbi:hypothetical protein QZH41_015633, partial [Actinostola sp. cb2023]